MPTPRYGFDAEPTTFSTRAAFLRPSTPTLDCVDPDSHLPGQAKELLNGSDTEVHDHHVVETRDGIPCHLDVFVKEESFPSVHHKHWVEWTSQGVHLWHSE